MDESENTGYVAVAQSVFSGDRLFVAGIVVASLGALWAGVSQKNVVIFGALLLLCLALVYLRFPRSWSMLLWLAGVYVLTAVGGLLVFGWRSVSTILPLTGLVLVLLGGYLAFLFIERVKDLRDSVEGEEYVTLGLWSLFVFFFFVVSLTSAYGVYRWYRGGMLLLYVVSEVFLVLSIPYILLKTEALGASILSSEGMIQFGDEKCAVCEALLSLEVKECPSCGSTRVFKWCPVCEAYAVTCPECMERTLWRDACGLCGSELSGEALCRDCRQSSPMSEWA